MTIYYSLSEIDAMCKKATKGAGYSWGEAEEVGRAGRWLSSYGIPGAQIVLDILNRDFADNLKNPIKLGNKINDAQYDLIDEDKNYQNVAYPVFLLPYISYAAYSLNKTIALNWISDRNKGQCLISDNSVYIDKEIVNLNQVEKINITKSKKFVAFIASKLEGYPVCQKTWQELDDLSSKMLAPATKESRDNAG